MKTLNEAIDDIDYTLAHTENTDECQELIGLIAQFVNRCEESGTLKRESCFIF